MDLRQSLIQHEGWKNKVYTDTVGKQTIGVGFNLTDVGLYDNEISFILDNRIALATKDAETLTCYKGSPPIIQDVLVELVFNLGIVKLRQFNTFLNYIDAGLFLEAAADLEGTLWYRQVGNRGKDLCGVIRSAEDVSKTPDTQEPVA